MARVTLRLPDHLHQLVRRTSNERGVSLNDLIVDTLKSTFEGQTSGSGLEHSVVERARNLRFRLGDLAAPVNPPKVAARLSPNAGLEEREAFRKSFPTLHPPLSATIIEDREDRF